MASQRNYNIIILFITFSWILLLIYFFLLLFLDDDDPNHKTRGRRSKNDGDGRNFTCDKCGKSYLSYPALYTHQKLKHEDNKADQNNSRGRGRPKKDTGEETVSLYFIFSIPSCQLLLTMMMLAMTLILQIMRIEQGLLIKRK